MTNAVDSLHSFLRFQHFPHTTQHQLDVVVQLSPLLDVLAGDPGGHGHQGVQAGQLGEVEPAVCPRPLTGPGVSVLLHQESDFSGHWFLETTRYELVNKLCYAPFLDQVWYVVISDGLQGATQPFEDQITLPPFVFRNCLQIKEEDTMNMSRA